jgi:nucleotide-binding universal stress UspA family protein
MRNTIIVAYDATPHAEDALILGRRLAERLHAGVTLAHVYRTSADAPHGRERFLRLRAHELLSAVAEPGETIRPIGSTTTATGLRELATEEGALAIVFGSAYDAPQDRAHPGSAARRLLQGSPSALVFAPAELRVHGEPSLESVAGTHDDDDQVARTVAALSRDGDAVAPEDADLLVVGSRAGAERGRVMVNATAEQTIQGAGVPVLVLPAGVALVPDAEVATA